MNIPNLVSCFRVLHDWRVWEGQDPGMDLWAQSVINRRQKTAIICPWSPDGEQPPADYYLHEILHVAIRAYEMVPEAERHEAEEHFVQDLCVLFSSGEGVA